jgi:L-fuconolactonase
MPNFPIIDSHVHLYDVQRLSYGWLASVPPINRTYLVEDFDAARGRVEVDKFVFAEVAVDPGLHFEEAAMIQSLADKDPRLAGIVAHAPVEKGTAVADDLARLAQNRNLRGIRRLIQGEPDPAMCLAPNFLAGVRTCAKHGLPFDICVKGFALMYGVELARRCPEVTFVLDHIGKPDIKYGLCEPWFSEITELARMPNVYCKVSGVITEADHGSWTKEHLKPYIMHVIESFGFDRCLYGSDWTVSELTHRYPTFVEILDEFIAGSSEEEKRKLYRDTATKVYRL